VSTQEAETERLRGELQAARLTITELERRVSTLERRVAAEQASAAHFAQQVQDLRNSRSWQVTVPLRAAMRRGRG
jgi:chromosome segregation ATPase